MRLDGSRLALGNGQRTHEGDDVVVAHRLVHYEERAVKTVAVGLLHSHIDMTAVVHEVFAQLPQRDADRVGAVAVLVHDGIFPFGLREILSGLCGFLFGLCENSV